MREKRWLLTVAVVLCYAIQRVTAKRQNGNIESEWSLN